MLLVVFPNLRYRQKILIINMIDICHFVCNKFVSCLGNTTSLKNISGTRLSSTVREKHFVINCPVLVVLFQKNLRLHTRTASREILPPMLGFVCLRIERQLLAVYTNRLASEFLRVLFYHFFSTFLLNFGSCSGWAVLLLHSKVAHFTFI
jgi:hypothetical protein